MSTTTTTTTSSSKSVTFAKSAKMRFAFHINKYTDEEINACFYTKTEYDKFKKDVKQIIRKLSVVENAKKKKIPLSLSLSSQNGNENDDFSTTTTTRGIESIQQLKAKLEIREAALFAVIKAQSSFCLANEDDDEALIVAEAYSTIVQPSTAMAYAKGLADEKIAQQNEEDVHHRNDYMRKKKNIQGSIMKAERTTATTTTNISAKFMMMRGSNNGGLWRLPNNNRTARRIRNHAA